MSTTATAPEPSVKEAKEVLSLDLFMPGSSRISFTVTSVMCLLLSLATTIPALTWPNSIMFARVTIPLTKPKQAFEMSKIVAVGGRSRESWTRKAVAGSR